METANMKKTLYIWALLAITLGALPGVSRAACGDAHDEVLTQIDTPECAGVVARLAGPAAAIIAAAEPGAVWAPSADAGIEEGQKLFPGMVVVLARPVGGPVMGLRVIRRVGDRAAVMGLRLEQGVVYGSVIPVEAALSYVDQNRQATRVLDVEQMATEFLAAAAAAH